jgi:O-antigen/teichoic acid export membrane protein
LMVNGILMFGIFEGDRLIIGSSESLFPSSSYTLLDLGIYSATFSLTMAPTQFIANICSSLCLPLLSRTQKMAHEFQRQYVACCQGTCLAAAVVSILFITGGGRALIILYGSKYAAGGGIIKWLAAMWALRIIRVAPTLAAMALGDSKNTMIANSARTLALIGMAVAAATGARLVWIAISGFGGELLGLAVSVWRLSRKSGMSPSLCAKPSAVAAAGVVISSFTVWGFGDGLVAAIVSCVGCIVLVVLGMLAAFRALRHDVWFSVSKAGTSRALEM